MKVFLCGEGRHELGGWSVTPPYRGAAPEPGVLEALLRRIQPDGWRVVGARVWKDVLTYDSKWHRGGLTRDQWRVRRLVVDASEAGADVLVFTRDSDGDPTRPKDVRAAVEEAAGAGVKVAGGCAVRELEAWLMAMRGVRRSEHISDPKVRLKALGVADLAARLAIVEAARLDQLPADANSLREWILRAEGCFTSRT